MSKDREILYFMVELKKLRILALSITGLTERELIILTSIDEQNRYGTYGIGVQVSNLSDILHIARPTMTKIINELEDEKYVEKISDKTDRRNVYLKITAKGDAILDKSANEVINQLTLVLGKEKAQEYYLTVKKLTNLINEIRQANNE